MVSAAATGLLLLGLPSCADGRTPEEVARDETIALLESNYASALRGIRPSYVVLTYPSTYSALPPSKQLEADVITRVLKAQKIPHTHGRRADFLEQTTIRTRRSAADKLDLFRVPADVIESCSGGKVVFLNLGVQEALSPAKHPDAKDADIDVMVWNDPIAVKTRRVPSY